MPVLVHPPATPLTPSWPPPHNPAASGLASRRLGNRRCRERRPARERTPCQECARCRTVHPSLPLPPSWSCPSPSQLPPVGPARPRSRSSRFRRLTDRTPRGSSIRAPARAGSGWGRVPAQPRTVPMLLQALRAPGGQSGSGWVQSRPERPSSCSKSTFVTATAMALIPTSASRRTSGSMAR